MNTPGTKRGIVAALALALLMITALPVSAANVAVVSEHTTGDDFTNATTTDGFVVSGSGDSAVLKLDTATTLEDFETSTISDYSGDTAAFEIDSGEAYAGSESLEIPDGTTVNKIYGAGVSVSAGNTYTYRQYITTEDESAGAMFGHSTGGSNTGYLIQLNDNANRLRVFKGDGSGGYTDIGTTTGVEYPNNEWLEVTFDWSSSGESTVTVKDADGNTIDTVSFTDSSYTSGTVAYRRFSGGARWDTLRAESGGDVSNANYVSQTHTVDNPQDAGIEFTALSDATANVEWEYNDGGTWQTYSTNSYTTTGNKTVDVSGVSATDWRVNVTVSNVGSNPVMQIDRDYMTGNTFSPSVDNTTLAPTGTLEGSTPTFTVDVSDPDFAGIGDTLTADLYVDGSVVGTDTLSSNGTASVTATVAGESTYHWEITDQYGNAATSESVDIRTPSKLYIFNETAPYGLVNQTTVDVTATGSSGTTVDLLETSDGSVTLSGLPPDENYIMTVGADGYYPKEIYVEDLYSQQNVYLVPKSITVISNRVTVTDRTGQFGDSTILIVERVIDTDLQPKIVDNGTEWVIVGGDRLGQSGFYSVELEEYGRYRFKVRNADGDTRVLGEYTAKSDGLVELQVGSVTYEFGDSDGYEWDASLTNVTNGNYSATLAYNDHAGETENVTMTFTYRDSGEIFAQETFNSGPYGEVVYTVPVNQSEYENESFLLEWTAYRNGEKITGSQIVGGDAKMDYPLSPMWTVVAFATMILALAFLVGSGAGPGPALVTIGLAGGFMVYIGLAPLELGMGSVILVLALGGAYTMRDARGV